MSSRALAWAFNQPVSHIYKSTLLALAEYANGDGLVAEYQEVLAADAGCDRRTLRRHLDHLEAMGFISRNQQKRADGGKDKCQVQLLATEARRPSKTPPSGQNDRTPPDNMSEQGTSFIPIEIKDVPNNTTAITEAMRASLPETDGGAGQITNPEPQTPDGAASGEARLAAASQVLLKNTHQNGGNVNVTGSEKVPPPAATPFRAALRAIDAAGLTPTWLQWIRSNTLRQVAQEAQAAVWQEWIEAGQAAPLKANVLDLVQSGGSFSHPWGALKARMLKAATATAQALPTHIPFKPGHRVRYEDGSDALVLDVRARGITTDHPLYPDVPLSRLKTLELVR